MQEHGLHFVRNQVRKVKDTCTKGFYQSSIQYSKESFGFIIVEGNGSEVKKQSRKDSCLNHTQSLSPESDQTKWVYQLRVRYQMEPCFLITAECQST